MKKIKSFYKKVNMNICNNNDIKYKYIFIFVFIY